MEVKSILCAKSFHPFDNRSVRFWVAISKVIASWVLNEGELFWYSLIITGFGLVANVVGVNVLLGAMADLGTP